MIAFSKAIPSDIPRLLEIEASSFSTNRISAKSFKHFIEGANADIIVAISEDVIVAYGIVLYRKNSKKSRVYSIAVCHSQIGKGLGKWMMGYLEQSAKLKGCSEIFLEVNVNNEPAIGLYKKLGYQILKTISEYYANGDNAYKMQKTMQG